MGGSILVDRCPGQVDEPVWWADRASLVAALTRPDRLDRARPLTAVGLLDDFTVVPFFKSLRGYRALCQQLRAAFPDSVWDGGDPDDPIGDATIVAFPYDFRQGVAPAAEALARVVDTHRRHLCDPGVIVVAHSMGGLVARRWAAQLDDPSVCRGIITLGTPHRGAPKALDILLNGLCWRSQVIERPALSAVVQDWPGLVDLVGTGLRFQGKGSAEWVAGHELDGVPHASRLVAAAQAHGAVDARWAVLTGERRSRTIPFVGVGHGTLGSGRWDGHRLRVSRVPLRGESHGDATVPPWSAYPTELSGPGGDGSGREHRARHGDLAGLDEVIAAIRALDNPDVPSWRPALRGVEELPSAVGLDLDDMADAGRPIEGWLLPTEARGLDGVVVRAVHIGTEGGASTELPVDVDAAGWISIGASPPPGTVDVFARRGDRLLAHETVAVVT